MKETCQISAMEKWIESGKWTSKVDLIALIETIDSVIENFVLEKN
jgi:hypothetical protein